jgi:pimeloyl-ACP methyl ester carboxylesterase
LARPIIFLCPGFLGFQKLGHLPYFPGVAEALGRALSRVGLDAEIAAIANLPTSSLDLRAARLCERIEAAAGDAGDIHLIGHSTGGLDCRLFASAGATLPTNVDVVALAARVRSIVTVSTPHHGTPLAGFFVGMQGHRMLGLLSLLTTRLLRVGRHPLRGVVALARGLVLLDRLTGLDTSLLDHLQQQVLDGLPDEHRIELERMLGDMGEDQRLIQQLTPVSLALLNASAGDRPGVRYGCVVTRGPKPRKRSLLRVSRDPYAMISRILYFAMHRVASTSDPKLVNPLDRGQIQALTDAFGDVPEPAHNDGIVPTLSQVRGEIVTAVEADHLDAMGYFRDEAGVGVDWLASDSGFDRRRFEGLWRRVGEFIASC